MVPIFMRDFLRLIMNINLITFSVNYNTIIIFILLKMYIICLCSLVNTYAAIKT